MQRASSSAQAAGVAGGAGATTATATPAPVVPAASATSPYGQTSRDALAREFTLGNQLASGARQEGDVPADITQAQQKELADQQQPVNAADYKPSFGQRVLRGLRGFAVGALTGGVPGALVGAIEPGDLRGGKGYSAPTDAYDKAVSAHNQQLQGDATTLQNATDNWKRQQDAWKARQEGLNDAGTRMGAVVTGATGAENADSSAARVPIDQQNANTDAQKAWNLSPDGKLDVSQKQFDQRTAFADRMKMPPGLTRARYILTGQMPTPHEPSAQEIALGDATRIFARENGHPPQTLEEFQKVVEAAKGGAGGRGGSDQDASARAIAADSLARKEAWASQYTRDPQTGNYQKVDAYGIPHETLSPQQFATKIEQFRADANKAMAGKGYQINEQGAFVPIAASPAAPGGGSHAKNNVPPPASLLAKTAEGGYVYGKNGEAWRKVNGKWAQ